MSQLMVSYRGLRPPAWVLERIEQGSVASVCLFSYNVLSPAQVRETSEELRRAASRGGHAPPLIGIDQEGGQLMTVGGGASELPGNMALGATRSPELAERAGRLLGLELLAMGCNLDFAPVLDLATHLTSAVVGTRSFGDDPQLVAIMGAALVRGLQSTGTLATAKHFPGHGDTDLDSHHEAPSVRSSREQLEAMDLVPFRAALQANVAAVMSAHVRFPALDGAPATLSKAILQRLLRESLRFEGLIITDAMDMAPVADGPALLRVGQALEAGADLVLLGHLPQQPELLSALVPHFREMSLRRIERVRRSLSRELVPFDLLGCEEHRRLAQEIADRAVTLVGEASCLPLALSSDQELPLLTIEPENLSPADSSARVEFRLEQQLRARHSRVHSVRLQRHASEHELRRALDLLASSSTAIVCTVDASQDESQQKLLARIGHRGLSCVHLVLRSPADLAFTPPGAPALCTYGIRRHNSEAAVRALFGEITASGVLPVRVPGTLLAGRSSAGPSGP